MQMRNWNPKDGQAFQGDVAIVPVPAGIKIEMTDEIRPVDGRLILQEGEVTGHHHAISLEPKGRERNFRPADAAVADPFAGATSGLRDRLRGKQRAEPAVATAHLYRDRDAARSMVAAGILDRDDLCVGFLVVKGGSVVVRHEEHDAIKVPPGSYYVGRQIESAGAEERRVED